MSAFGNARQVGKCPRLGRFAAARTARRECPEMGSFADRQLLAQDRGKLSVRFRQTSVPPRMSDMRVESGHGKIRGVLHLHEGIQIAALMH
jgi:hypothetical protein